MVPRLQRWSLISVISLWKQKQFDHVFHIYAVNPSLAEHEMSFKKANWSGSALFVIKYVNFYQKPGLSNLHYENTPIQICKKFHLQKLKIFR